MIEEGEDDLGKNENVKKVLKKLDMKIPEALSRNSDAEKKKREKEKLKGSN